MRYWLVILLAALVSVPAAVAQESSLFLSSQRAPVRVSLGAAYQNYAHEDVNVQEVSIPLTLSAPLGRGLGLTLTAHQASVEGDTLESLSGVADVQVGLSYVIRLAAGSLVLNVGANLPSGKRELTPGEFATTVLLSQHYYRFQVPGFGQGFNVAPGVVWAFQVSEIVTAGLGAAYHYRGAYQPLSTLDAEYDPGDEVVLTGGLDVRTAPTTNLSADVTYTLYGSDAFGEQETFDPGDKVTATVQLLSLFGPSELRLVARYRSVTKSTRPAELTTAGEEELRLLPAQLLLHGTYRHAFSEPFTLGLLAQARLFDENVLFESATLLDVGLLPTVAVTPRVTLLARAVYTLGDLTGLEAGGGLVVEL